MDFFEAVEKRRSVRKFLDEVVPDEVITKAIEAAVIAPNSSNTQTWNFYWVRSPEKKKMLVEFCMSQSAARAAPHLIVVTADPKLWKRAHAPLLQFIESVNAPKPVHDYYRKLLPVVYRWGLFNINAVFKWLVTTFYGFFKPIQRGPYTRRDLQEVAIKSAALASENFVLAISAQGYASCMMEGFDECRVKKLLGLSFSGRVVMVIAVGREGPRGTWGPRFRLNRDEVIHRI